MKKRYWTIIDPKGPKNTVVHKHFYLEGLIHHLCGDEWYRKGFLCCSDIWEEVTCKTCLQAFKDGRRDAKNSIMGEWLEKRKRAPGRKSKRKKGA